MDVSVASVHLDDVDAGGQRGDIDFSLRVLFDQSTIHVINVHGNGILLQPEDAANSPSRVRRQVNHTHLIFVHADTSGQVQSDHRVAAGG